MTVPRTISDDGGVGGKIGGGGSGGTTSGGTTTTTATPAPTPTPAPVAGDTPATIAIQPAIVASSASGGYAITVSRIPLQSVPAQSLAIQLGGQSCTISVRQRSTGLFLDLRVNDVPIASGLLCRDRVWLIRDAYLGFAGDLAFVDTIGSDDPNYTQLADRFQLLWGR